GRARSDWWTRPRRFHPARVGVGGAGSGADCAALSLVGGLIKNFQDVLSGTDEVVEGGSAFLRRGQRWPTDDPALCVGRHAEDAQVATVVGRVVVLVPTFSYGVREGGQEDGDLKLTGVHVLVGVTVHSGGLTGFVPVLPGGEEPDPGAALNPGLLDEVGEHVVATVAVHDEQPPNPLTLEGLGDVVHDGRQGGGADADRPGEVGVLVGAGEGQRGEPKRPVPVADPVGDRHG